MLLTVATPYQTRRIPIFAKRDSIQSGVSESLRLSLQVLLLKHGLLYRVVPGDRNWHIETADWNLAGFL